MAEPPDQSPKASGGKAGAQLRKYSSKRAIYKDFSIAIKFILDENNGLRDADYDKIRTVISRKCAAKIGRIPGDIAGMLNTDPVSVGFFVEIPGRDFTGRECLVLLQHEDGVEVFVKAVESVIEWLPWLQSLIGGWLGSKALDQLVQLLRKCLSNTVQRSVKVTHVEIRTEFKGVIRMPFQAFHARQIQCLAKRLSAISHVSECNCFGSAWEIVNGSRQNKLTVNDSSR